MADNFAADFSDVTRMAGIFTDVPKQIKSLVPKALAVTARHIKDDWKEPLQGSATVPQGARAISYDIDKNTIFGTDIYRAEIGPELKGQGAIVGILEYGTPSTTARGFGAAALEKNQGDFEKGMQIAVEQAEKAAGL